MMTTLRLLAPTLYQFTGFVLTAAGFGAATLLYALVDRAPPRVDLMGHPSKTEFRQGEEFEGVRLVTVQRECPGRSVRWVTSAQNPLWVMQLPDASLYYQNAGQGPLPRRISIAVASFPIPHDMPPGKYAYHVRGVFYCNRAQEWLDLPITIDAPVIEFNVTPAEESDPRRNPQRSGVPPLRRAPSDPLLNEETFGQGTRE